MTTFQNLLDFAQTTPWVKTTDDNDWSYQVYYLFQDLLATESLTFLNNQGSFQYNEEQLGKWLEWAKENPTGRFKDLPDFRTYDWAVYFHDHINTEHYTKSEALNFLTGATESKSNKVTTGTTTMSNSTSINFSSAASSAKSAANNTTGVNFMLDLCFKACTSDNAKIIAAHEERMTNIEKFVADMGLVMFPTPSQLVIIRDNQGKPSITRKALEALVNSGVELVGIKRTMHYNKIIKEEGADLKLFGSINTTPFDKTEHANCETVNCERLGLYMAKHVLTQMAAWLPTDYAKLTSLLFPKTAVDTNGTKVVFGTKGFANHECSIDFNSLEVKMGLSPVRTANKQVQIGTEVIDSQFALFVLGTMLGNASGNPSSLKDAVNKLTSLWVRSEDYGIKFSESETAKNDATAIVHQNLCLPVAITSARKSEWPWLALQNDSFDVGSLKSMLEREGVVAIDKYGMKWVTLRKGAEAMMLGRLGDMILNPHDASKASKFFNRPTQAFKFTKADSKHRIASSLRIALSDGSFSVPGGVPLMTAYTNSRLAMGSGVALLNPSKSIEYTVDKTVKGELNIMRLQGDLRRRMMATKDPVQTLKAALEKIIKSTVLGKRFLPGDVMLALDGGNHVIIKNSYDNQDLLVTNYKINAREGSDLVEITLNVRIEGDDQCVKLRGMGVKLTTLPYEVTGLNDGWEIMLNIETEKGKIGLVHMYAIANGGGVYYPNEGVLKLDNGTVVDLKEATNPYTQWVQDKANTQVQYIQMHIAKAEWDIIEKCFPNADDVRVLEDHGTYVLVEERIQVVYGMMPYDVEVSTPRENTGASGLTLEQLANLSLQNRELAEKLHAESAEYKQVVCNLVGLVAGEPVLPEIETWHSAGRQAFRDLVQSNGRSDRDILVAIQKAYPGGVALLAKSDAAEKITTLRLHAPVISKMGAFMGGSASDVAGKVVAALNYLLDAGTDEESGVNNVVHRSISMASAALEGWMEKMTQSGGVLKRLGRTKKLLVNAKVKTSYHPMLNGIDGLPVIVLHPDCATVKMLNAKDGDIIGVGRTPMPFITSCIVRISAEVGQVAHIMLLPHIWAAGNEGDSDGDGIFSINLSQRGVTRDQARAMNLHIMGQSGYAAVYGADPSGWPYAAFVSYDDKWGKKAVTYDGKAIVCQLHADQYTSDACLVESHYTAAVGVSYGVCSVLSFYAANMAYTDTPKEELAKVVNATNIAWRVMYEGLGLAGYSPEAKEFFDVLGVAVWADGYTKAENGKLEFAFDSKVKDYNSCLPVLVNLLVKSSGLTVEAATEALDIMLTANKVRATIGRLEKGGKKVHPALPEEGALFGALRRLGQGRYGVDAIEEAMANEENAMRSTFTLVEEGQLHLNLAAPFLRDTLATAVIVHRTLADKAVDDEANEGLGE